MIQGCGDSIQVLYLVWLLWVSRKCSAKSLRIARLSYVAMVRFLETPKAHRFWRLVTHLCGKLHSPSQVWLGSFVFRLLLWAFRLWLVRFACTRQPQLSYVAIVQIPPCLPLLNATPARASHPYAENFAHQERTSALRFARFPLKKSSWVSHKSLVANTAFIPLLTQEL